MCSFKRNGNRTTITHSIRKRGKSDCFVRDSNCVSHVFISGSIENSSRVKIFLSITVFSLKTKLFFYVNINIWRKITREVSIATVRYDRTFSVIIIFLSCLWNESRDCSRGQISTWHAKKPFLEHNTNVFDLMDVLHTMWTWTHFCFSFKVNALSRNSFKNIILIVTHSYWKWRF